LSCSLWRVNLRVLPLLEELRPLDGDGHEPRQRVEGPRFHHAAGGCQDPHGLGAHPERNQPDLVGPLGHRPVPRAGAGVRVELQSGLRGFEGLGHLRAVQGHR
jgi:hypothetical protein